MYKVIFGIALTCMLLQLGECETNCQLGKCKSNKEIINVNPPEQSPLKIDVCCKPSGSVIGSQFYHAGSATATDSAYCVCDYTRVRGSCLRGEKCTHDTAQAFLNDMPICCSKSSDLLTVTADKVGEDELQTYTCGCEIACTGNRWIGDQCDGCAHVGNIYGVKICCPHCANKGFRITGGDPLQCDCV